MNSLLTGLISLLAVQAFAGTGQVGSGTMGKAETTVYVGVGSEFSSPIQKDCRISVLESKDGIYVLPPSIDGITRGEQASLLITNGKITGALTSQCDTYSHSPVAQVSGNGSIFNITCNGKYVSEVIQLRFDSSMKLLGYTSIKSAQNQVDRTTCENFYKSYPGYN
jgi:hypothetical protein